MNDVSLALEDRNQAEAMSGNPENAQTEQIEDLNHLG